MKQKASVFNESMQGKRFWQYAHCKRDGHFISIESPCDRLAGDVRVFTSNPTDITHALRGWHPNIKAFAATAPSGCIILAEMWASGVPASSIKTLINNEDPRLQVQGFAVHTWPNVSGESLKACSLETAADMVQSCGLQFIEYRKLHKEQKISELLLDRKFDPDLEGYVLKNGNLLDWFKLKPELTIDLVFTNITNGEGKYQGLVGSVVCRTAEGYEVANVSGMDDDIRAYITKHWRSLLGSVVEVEYQGVGSLGRLRHPRFKRFRDDKPASQCTIDQDEILQNTVAKRHSKC